MKGRGNLVKGLILAVVVLLGCTSCDLFGGFGRDGGLEETPQEVKDFVQMMNDHREDLGLSRLIWDDRVYQVALAHSEDMKDRDFFAHTNPDGKDPFDRLGDAGIEYWAAAENIAYGYSTGAAVLNGWLNSAGHKANIENGTFTHHGVGYVADGHYWTHVFLKPRD